MIDIPILHIAVIIRGDTKGTTAIAPTVATGTGRATAKGTDRCTAADITAVDANGLKASNQVAEAT